MAELAIVRVSLKLAWTLIANRAIKSLEHGDLADEKLRQLLLSEFRKLHEELNALRRKELVAAVAFMENGYQLLKDDGNEAKKEFNKARDSAQVALGVVEDVQDKILATKIMVTSSLHEFEDKPDVAISLCMKYMSRLNTLPEVQKAAEVALGQKFGSKLRAFAGTTNRQNFLGAVSEVNRCVWEFIQHELGDKAQEKEWPLISLGSHNVDPLTSFLLLRRESSDPTYLPSNIRAPLFMVTANKKLFLAESRADQPDDPLLTNCLKVLDLETGDVTSLAGHTAMILSITKLTGDTHVITGSMDKQLIVWDAQTLKCYKILTGHSGSIRAVVSNNSYIFSGSTDSVINVWSCDTFELSHTLTSHKGPISLLAVSNRHLFSYAVGEGIKYWDLKKWECIHDIAAPESICSMHIVGNNLVMHYCSELHLINLGNLKECGKMVQVGKSSIIVGKNILCFQGSELKSWDVALTKMTGSVNLNKANKSYTIHCSCYDSMSGRLYLACSESGFSQQNVIISF